MSYLSKSAIDANAITRANEAAADRKPLNSTTSIAKPGNSIVIPGSSRATLEWLDVREYAVDPDYGFQDPTRYVTQRAGLYSIKATLTLNGQSEQLVRYGVSIAGIDVTNTIGFPVGSAVATAIFVIEEFLETDAILTFFVEEVNGDGDILIHEDGARWSITYLGEAEGY